MLWSDSPFCFFFFNDTATTEIYTLSLHDALPISGICTKGDCGGERWVAFKTGFACLHKTSYAWICIKIFFYPCYSQDRKSTRLNSSHSQISYAVFCLKKKQTTPRCPLRAATP